MSKLKLWDDVVCHSWHYIWSHILSTYHWLMISEIRVSHQIILFSSLATINNLWGGTLFSTNINSEICLFQWFIVDCYTFLFWGSNCPRFGHWEPLQSGSYDIITCSHHFFFFLHLFSIYTSFKMFLPYSNVDDVVWTNSHEEIVFNFTWQFTNLKGNQ